jgi:hypothetical protein
MQFLKFTGTKHGMFLFFNKYTAEFTKGAHDSVSDTEVNIGSYSSEETEVILRMAQDCSLQLEDKDK